MHYLRAWNLYKGWKRIFFSKSNYKSRNWREWPNKQKKAHLGVIGFFGDWAILGLGYLPVRMAATTILRQQPPTTVASSFFFWFIY